MGILGRKELAGMLRFAVDPARQVEEDRLLLTVLDVEQVTGEAVLGPQGADTSPARRVKRPARRSSADDTGWWELAQGVYTVTYNERVELASGHVLWLQPYGELMDNGLWHPTIMVTDWDRDAGAVMLTVAARGVKIAENTVISTAAVFSV